MSRGRKKGQAVKAYAPSLGLAHHLVVAFNGQYHEKTVRALDVIQGQEQPPQLIKGPSQNPLWLVEGIRHANSGQKLPESIGLLFLEDAKQALSDYVIKAIQDGQPGRLLALGNALAFLLQHETKTGQRRPVDPDYAAVLCYALDKTAEEATYLFTVTELICVANFFRQKRGEQTKISARQVEKIARSCGMALKKLRRGPKPK